jgi:two-component system sensor histidine kinase VicK
MKTKSEELLPLIETIAKIGSYETDLATGTWVGSENFISIFGLEKKEQYGVEEFQALVHPDDFERVMTHFAKCLEKKIDFNCDYRCLKPNGEVIYVSSRSKVFYSPAGKPLRVLGVKQDITESKKTEILLRELNDNNEKKNEVLSMVAHDLRTPIAQLEGLSSILRRILDPEHHNLLELQARICAGAKSIISELMETAELEHQTTLHLTETDINDLMDRCIERFQFERDNKHMTFRKDFAERCIARVNPEKLARAIDNLISNALKFTPENRTIEFVTHTDERQVTLIIRDEGVGIKPEVIPHLFEKFSTVARRPGVKGERSTGLGLSIVKQIINLHKGTISVHSNESKGSTFSLHLPV